MQTELHDVQRRLAWNRELGIPAVSPGTSTEAYALARLEQARHEESAQQLRRGKRATVRLT